MINSIFINTIRTFNDHSGEFKGNVSSVSVPKEITTEFEDQPTELIVNGKFEFETLDNVLLVRMVNLSLSDGNRVIDLDLDKLDGNEIYDLEERLANSSTLINVVGENDEQV